MNKTVYFLGAGFSADAGGPIQNQIIQFILDPEFSKKFDYKPYLKQARLDFINFIKEKLLIPDSLIEKISLEDIFTPIDRAISSGKSFKDIDSKRLVELREKFHFLMGVAIHFGVDYKGKSKVYIENFAKYINNIAKRRLDDLKKDEIAIITSNWDILLDNELNKLTREFSENDQRVGNKRLAVLDYCCYISSLQNDEFIKPGLFALGKEGYNIKYLKLHGSMNWLHCPNCQRMYIKYNVKTMLSNQKYCKHCKTNYGLDNVKSIELKSNLLLPTFIKDLSNIQIQLIWQNAGIELSEASKIVFIGYSLPQADFEIRQLLSRCIPNHTEIEVVLYPGRKNNLKSEEDKNAEMIPWKTFFGNRIKSEKNFIFKTVPDYVESLKNQNF